jgi:hypothetical protein
MTARRQATVERLAIHGKALDGNVAVGRAVLVFLPPGYASERSRRCPPAKITTVRIFCPLNSMTKAAPGPTQRRPDSSLTHWQPLLAKTPDFAKRP